MNTELDIFWLKVSEVGPTIRDTHDYRAAERTLLEIVRIVQTSPEKRALFEDAFLKIFEESPHSDLVLEYCMHVLRFPRVFRRGWERIARDPLAVDAVARHVVGAYSNNWIEASIFKSSLAELRNEGWNPPQDSETRHSTSIYKPRDFIRSRSPWLRLKRLFRRKTQRKVFRGVASLWKGETQITVGVRLEELLGEKRYIWLEFEKAPIFEFADGVPKPDPVFENPPSGFQASAISGVGYAEDVQFYQAGLDRVELRRYGVAFTSFEGLRLESRWRVGAKLAAALACLGALGEQEQVKVVNSLGWEISKCSNESEV